MQLHSWRCVAIVYCPLTLTWCFHSTKWHLLPLRVDRTGSRESQISWTWRYSYTIAWPPRSPDLALLYFFPCIFCPELSVPNFSARSSRLRLRVLAAIDKVTPIILSSVWIDIEYSLDAVRATNGAQIEVY